MWYSWYRIFMQVASSVLSNGYISSFLTKTVNTNFFKGICVPYMNCYACPVAIFSCPIGTLQHFMAIRVIPYMLLGFFGIVGLSMGRMACGWLCPFGFLQDLVHYVPSSKYKVPQSLLQLKYAFLIIFVIALPFLTGEAWFSKICPIGTLTAGIPWVLWNPINPTTNLPILLAVPGLQFSLALVILLSFFVWFVFVRRPFCKIICPLGAIFSLFSRYSFVQLNISKACNKCNWCRTVCPMDVDIPLEVNSGECILCLECSKCEHVKLVSPFEGRKVRQEKNESRIA